MLGLLRNNVLNIMKLKGGQMRAKEWKVQKIQVANDNAKSALYRGLGFNGGEAKCKTTWRKEEGATKKTTKGKYPKWIMANQGK